MGRGQCVLVDHQEHRGSYVSGFLASCWLVAIYGYALLMFANQRRKQAPMPLFWAVHLWPLAIVVLAIDFAFNWTFGFMFLRPRWALFSSTVQWYVRNGDGWRLSLARFWLGVLNWPDPSHIRS